MKIKKNKKINLLGIILINIIFIGLLIFAFSTQIEIEKSTTKFFEITGDIVYQKEKSSDIFDTMVKTSDNKLWLIRNDKKRDINTKVSFFVQVPSYKQQDTPDENIVEIVKRGGELHDENIFADN